MQFSPHRPALHCQRTVPQAVTALLNSLSTIIAHCPILKGSSLGQCAVARSASVVEPPPLRFTQLIAQLTQEFPHFPLPGGAAGNPGRNECPEDASE